MSRSKYSIILVEDNPVEAELLQEYLSNQFAQDFEVFHARSLTEFEVAFRSIHCDAIILDLSLPDSEGIETILRIQSLAGSKPLIVLTGNDSDELAVRSIQKGAQEYISKDQIDALSIVRIIVQSIERQKIRNAMLLDEAKKNTKEQQFKQIIESASCGIVMLDRANTIKYCNKKARELFAIEDVRSTGYKFKHTVSDKGTITIRSDKYHTTKILQTNVESCKYDSKLRIVYAFDITKYIATRDSLLQSANYDSMTKIYNRQYFDKSLSRMFEKCQHNDAMTFSLCLVDCDNFKKINDIYGHDVGDQVLMAAASILEESIRPSDVVARIGGDEFAIILDNVGSAADIITLCRRMIGRFDNELRIQGKPIKATVSLGIARYDSHYENPDQLYKDADKALYAAKEQGRDRYEIFDYSMKASAIIEETMEDKLHSAIENMEFDLTFQPMSVAYNGDIVGYEALLRWQADDCLVHYPEEIFQLAGNIGYEFDIDNWVIEKALKRISSLRKQNAQASPLHLNVNLQIRTIMHHEFAGRLARLCAGNNIKNKDVILEINHSALESMRNHREVENQISCLKDKGFEILLDNFGKRNSDLDTIRKLMPRYVELGRNIIEHINEKPYIGLIKSLVDYCHFLDIQVVAEGIESQPEYETLNRLGVDYVKGRHLSGMANVEVISDDQE